MKGGSSYVPPPYIPLDQSDPEADVIPSNNDTPAERSTSGGPSQWSSGICACCDDMQSCTLLSDL